MMDSMMRETIASGTARHADLPGWLAAGKTGTSQDFRDAWFIGFTGHMVTGVWLGNDDSSPTKKLTGGSLPVDIWSRFMKVAHQRVAGGGIAGGRLVRPVRTVRRRRLRRRKRRRGVGRRAASDSGHRFAATARRSAAASTVG